jgi:hypothetical protein
MSFPQRCEYYTTPVIRFVKRAKMMGAARRPQKKIKKNEKTYLQAVPTMVE